jgi:hypothetical protein
MSQGFKPLADWRTGGLAHSRTGGLADWRTRTLAHSHTRTLAHSHTRTLAHSRAHSQTLVLPRVCSFTIIDRTLNHPSAGCPPWEACLQFLIFLKLERVNLLSDLNLCCFQPTNVPS